MKKQTKTETVDVEYLRERLHYDPETGKLFWKDHKSMPKHWRTKWVGKEAFTSTDGHYFIGSVNSIRLYAHRVVWAIYYGKWPNNNIDHINGVKTDNRINNLRALSQKKNTQNACISINNTTGVNGVYWHKRTKKWLAKVVVDYKGIHLGYFDTIEEAAKARQEANEKYGFTERHGKPLDAE